MAPTEINGSSVRLLSGPCGLALELALALLSLPLPLVLARVLGLVGTLGVDGGHGLELAALPGLFRALAAPRATTTFLQCLCH